MNNDLDLSFEDKIQLYLDGELSKEAEVGMFTAIASNESLRETFREMLSIREEIRNDHRAFVPSPLLTERVLTTLGMGIPAGLMTSPTIGIGTTPIVTGAMSQMWITITALLSALVMAITSGYYYNQTTKYEGEFVPDSPNTITNNSNSNTNFENGNFASFSQMLSNIVEKSNSLEFQPSERIIYRYIQSPTSGKSTARNQKIENNNFENQTLKTIIDQKTKDLNDIQFQLDRANTSIVSEKQRSEQLSTQIQSLNEKVNSIETIRAELQKEIDALKLLKNTENSITKIEKPIAETPFEITSKDKKPKFSLSIGIRGLTSQSFPNPQLIQASETDFLNNIAISSLINITDNFSVGVEGGRENFGLQFSETIAPNTTVSYEKNPALLWGGLSVQGRTNPIESFWGIRPYLRTVVGGAPIGLLGKVIGGIELPITPTFSMSLATEGTFLQYSLQQNAFSTRKFGITYGVQMIIK